MSCPVCSKVFACMPKHLTRAHGVHNGDERRVLCNLSSGRVNIRGLACPVDGCTYELGRLDKHIVKAHPELTVADRERLLVRLRWAKTTQLLRELRATRPSPPLSSCLVGSGGDRSGTPPDNERPPPPGSGDGGPGTTRTRAVASRAVFPPSLGKTSPRNVQNVPRARIVTFAVCSPTEAFLTTFQRFLEGGRPGPKHRENVVSLVGRVRAFLRHMAADSQRLSDWLFLDDLGKLQR